MGCLLDCGDIIKIEKKYYAHGQGGCCGIHTQKSTKYQSKTFKKYVRYDIYIFLK